MGLLSAIGRLIEPAKTHTLHTIHMNHTGNTQWVRGEHGGMVQLNWTLGIKHFASLQEANTWGSANLCPAAWHVKPSPCTKDVYDACINFDVGNSSKERAYAIAQRKYLDDTPRREAAERAQAAQDKQRRQGVLDAWRKTGLMPNGSTPEFAYDGGGAQWAYVFTFESQLEIAKHTGKAPRMKIGMTRTQHYRDRVREQVVGSAVAEQPIIVMAMRCVDAVALERSLHSALSKHKDRNSVGQEWFKVTPQQILNAMGSRVSAV